MATTVYTAIIEKEGELYAALCPELDVASQGATVEEATANLREAVELFLECADPEAGVEVTSLCSGRPTRAAPQAPRRWHAPSLACSYVVVRPWPDSTSQESSRQRVWEDTVTSRFSVAAAL